MLSTQSMENANMPVRERSTGLWRLVKYRKAQKYSLWYDLDIPAKLFYKITENHDLTLLIKRGKPKEKHLQSAWYAIIDLVYKVRKDDRARNIQAKQVQIALLNHKIKAIEAIINVLYRVLMTDNQKKELINHLKRLKIYLKNASQKEIERVLKRDLKGLRAKLKIEIDRLAQMQKGTNKKMEYERVCLKLSRAIDLKLDLNMTLGEFLAAEAEAIEISNKLSKKNG